MALNELPSCQVARLPSCLSEILATRQPGNRQPATRLSGDASARRYHPNQPKPSHHRTVITWQNVSNSTTGRSSPGSSGATVTGSQILLHDTKNGSSTTFTGLRIATKTPTI